MGAGYCRHHGGNTIAHKKSAAVQLANSVLTASVRTFGLPEDVSPQQALVDEVRWTAGHVRWLREQVQKLDPKDLTWGLARIEHKNATEYPGRDIYEAAQVNVLIELYQRERRHLVDVCKIAIAAGIEERRVQLAEKQGQVLAAGLNKMFDQLGLSPSQRHRLPELMPAMFASIRDQWSEN